MAICKVCGGWSPKPNELCPACKRALKRLGGYAVLVTRCENCAESIGGDDCPEGRVWCKKMCRYMKNEGYCSFGEVKG